MLGLGLGRSGLRHFLLLLPSKALALSLRFGTGRQLHGRGGRRQSPGLEHEIAAVEAERIEFAVARCLPVAGQVGQLVVQEKAELAAGDVAVAVGIGRRLLAGERIEEQLAEGAVVGDELLGLA